MDMLPIADRLEAQGVGIQGKTIFINLMPIECTEGILLRSPLAGTRVDAELPSFYRSSFSVIVRGYDYEAAHSLMKDAMQALTFLDTEVDDIFIKYVRPATLPIVFPVSVANFYEIKVEFEICYIGSQYGY